MIKIIRITRKLRFNFKHNSSLRLVITDIVHCLLHISFKQLGSVYETMPSFAEAVRSTRCDGVPPDISHFHSATILAMSDKFLAC